MSVELKGLDYSVDQRSRRERFALEGDCESDISDYY